MYKFTSQDLQTAVSYGAELQLKIDVCSEKGLPPSTLNKHCEGKWFGREGMVSFGDNRCLVE